MTFEVQTDYLRDNDVIRIRLSGHSKAMSFRDVIHQWKTSEEFCQFYSKLLADIPFKAFFWETPALTKDRLDDCYQCVCVDSRELVNVEANRRAFSDYFENECSENSIIEFVNLSGDAKMVVPCPSSNDSEHAHLADFVRYSTAAQQNDFWKAIATLLDRTIGGSPCWLNTSGLGVYWLHARLDSVPKYYTWQPYTHYKIR